MSGRRRLVVIGNGMAGARLVEELVRRGATPHFDIVVFGEEPYGNYNRILLSGVLAGSHRIDDIVLNPLSWYRAHGIRLHAGVAANRIDRARRIVHGAEGVDEPFDVLVIATGSRPWVPPIEGLSDATGALVDGAFVFRSLDDCTAMLERASRATTAVVVGGGLLGLEAARGLLTRGLHVTLVHLGAGLMDVQLDVPASLILRRQFEAMGVCVRTGCATAAVHSADTIRGVRFADGSTTPCDLLVIAAGVRPNVDLARAAGLPVRTGIIVDDHLSCDGAHDIYALGECAEHRGKTFGLVAPLWDQATVLADRLAATRPHARYEGSLLTTKLKVAGLDVAVMGEKDALDGDEVIRYDEPSRDIYKKLIVRRDKLVGAILIGDGAVVPALAHIFTTGGALPAQRAELLFPRLADSPRQSVADLPDDAQICDCNGVSKAQIVDCALRGAGSAQAVYEQTRAGTGCGSCRPEVQRLLELTRQQLDANVGTFSDGGRDGAMAREGAAS